MMTVGQPFQKNPDCPSCKQELDFFDHPWNDVWTYHKGQVLGDSGSTFTNQ